MGAYRFCHDGPPRTDVHFFVFAKARQRNTKVLFFVKNPLPAGDQKNTNLRLQALWTHERQTVVAVSILLVENPRESPIFFVKRFF